MTRWLLRPLAEQDIEGINRYTQRTWGKRQARAYLGEIYDAIRRAAVSPEQGALYEHPKTSYRRVRSGRHLIIYRPFKDGIVVVRILHERMDIEAQLD